MSSQHVDSPDNHGAIISVVTWFLVVSATLAFITRIATKLAVSRRINGDDVLIFAALVSVSLLFGPLLKR